MDDRLLVAGRRAWALLGIIGVAAVALFVVWKVNVIFAPMLLAGTIVFLLNPVVNRLERRGVPRAAGTGIAYLGVIVGFLAVGFALSPVVGGQVDQLRDDFPEIRQDVEDFVNEKSVESELNDWPIKIPEWDKLLDEAGGPDRDLRDQIDQLREVGNTIFHVGLVIILGPIIAFYLLVDLPRTSANVQRLLPPSTRDEVNFVARKLNRTIGSYFRGQLAVALIVGVMCSIGLAIIGLKFSFIVGMIAGMFNIVPLIGPWIGGIPGVIIALTTGSVVQAIGVVVVMTAVQQIDNHFITPQVMQRAVSLHPAAVMLALLAGGAVAGFAGLLLAVPVTAVLRIVASHIWRHRVLNEPYEELNGVS